ncbi:hypothetical protein [Paenibacillus sp. LPE1-1-1.1]|uniref:hypothetical protein n=1 Tax=Paenibacillus sp. LPE1-1-1.1 TaxID=3135230 RepID=UPI00342CD9CB
MELISEYIMSIGVPVKYVSGGLVSEFGNGNVRLKYDAENVYIGGVIISIENITEVKRNESMIYIKFENERRPIINHMKLIVNDNDDYIDYIDGLIVSIQMDNAL